MMQKHLRAWLTLALVLSLAALALDAKTRKGEKFFKQGQEAEFKKDWDTALENYQKAVDESPTDSGYVIGMRRARFQAGQMHVDRGEKLRTEGKLEEAME